MYLKNINLKQKLHMESIMTFEQTLDIYTIEYDNDNFINLQWLFLSYFLRLLELESVEYELDDVAIELLVADA